MFARESFSAGELVAVWGGEVVDRETLRRGHSFGSNANTVQIDDDLFLVSRHEGPGDWLNHSCAPNLGMCGQIVVVAMRDIQSDEELCLDYAMTDGSDYDEFDCACGADVCRGRVTGEDWRIASLADSYRDYFSPYLARRIERERATLRSRGYAPPGLWGER